MSETRLIVNEDGIVTGIKTTGLEVLKSSDGSVAFFADTIEVDGEKVASEKELFDRLSR